MAFKMMGGKPLKQKTGAGIPTQMKSALYQRDMLTRVKDGVKAGIEGFDAKPEITTGGQGSPGSGSRKGNKDLIQMGKNAIAAASKAFKKKDPKPKPKKVVTKTPPGRQMKKGGPKQQNSKDKLDERLGVKDGAEKDKSQSMKSRRDESAAMQMKPKKKGGPKEYGKGPKQKESVKQEKKDLKENFLARKMEPKTK